MIQTQGRLENVKQFEDIIIKADFNQTGQVLRLKDVARVELGSKTYDLFAEKDGKPASLVAIYLLPGANALQTADAVKAVMTDRPRLALPLYLSPVAAGFPSPAEDYIEKKLDLNEQLIRNPAATFFVRVDGDSMARSMEQGEHGTFWPLKILWQGSPVGSTPGYTV